MYEFSEDETINPRIIKAPDPPHKHRPIRTLLYNCVLCLQQNPHVSFLILILLFIMIELGVISFKPELRENTTFNSSRSLLTAMLEKLKEDVLRTSEGGEMGSYHVTNQSMYT